jgi:hypothetical protein
MNYDEESALLAKFFISGFLIGIVIGAHPPVWARPALEVFFNDWCVRALNWCARVLHLPLRAPRLEL